MTAKDEAPRAEPIPEALLADHLRLGQWLSPGFPTSAYAYSHGLETEIAEARVPDAEALLHWISAVLRVGAGKSDLMVMLATRRGADPEAMADLARALAGSCERLEETEAQGAALAQTLAALGHGDGIARPYPVALGLAARALCLPDARVAALVLQGFAANLVSAAVRFMPLGQATGQRILADLQPVIASAAQAATQATLDDVGMAVFGADMAAMEHERQEVRIFRT